MREPLLSPAAQADGGAWTLGVPCAAASTSRRASWPSWRSLGSSWWPARTVMPECRFRGGWCSRRRGWRCSGGGYCGSSWRRWWGRRNPGILFARAAAWAAIPGTVVMAIVVGNTLVLLRARVWLSERALVSAAADLAAVTPDDLRERTQRVGLFWVREFQRVDSELRFITSECGLVDTCGLSIRPRVSRCIAGGFVRAFVWSVVASLPELVGGAG